MVECLCVGLGGFTGAVLRYLIGLNFSPTTHFPFTTMLINLTGAFLIGAVTEFSSQFVPLHPNLMLLLTVGLCGGFTTFSTFSLETVTLFESGKILLGAAYALLSVVLCLVGVLLGRAAIRFLMA